MTDLFLVAAEVSGDQLGASLIRALRRRNVDIHFRGVGGAAMAGEGFESQYPMAELAVFGFSSVIKTLPRLRRRLRETADAIVGKPPSALVLIDSYGFSVRLAKRVRKALPHLPIIKYVSPQIWASRPGRARTMRGLFDHVLALFPFEPEVYRSLAGPPCTYVGHPLIESLDELRPSADDKARRVAAPPLAVVMPGSRRSEIRHLSRIFGDALTRLQQEGRPLELVLPTLPHLVELVAFETQGWLVRPRIVTTEAEKYAAMRQARMAITASGTASLELALAQVPHIGAYRLRNWEAAIARRLIYVKNVLMPNILLGETVVPELLQENCTAANIAAAAGPLFDDGGLRSAQLAAFGRLDGIMEIQGGAPSNRAAGAILELIGQRTGQTGIPATPG